MDYFSSRSVCCWVWWWFINTGIVSRYVFLLPPLVSLSYLLFFYSEKILNSQLVLKPLFGKSKILYWPPQENTWTKIQRQIDILIPRTIRRITRLQCQIINHNTPVVVVNMPQLDNKGAVGMRLVLLVVLVVLSITDEGMEAVGVIRLACEWGEMYAPRKEGFLAIESWCVWWRTTDYDKRQIHILLPIKQQAPTTLPSLSYQFFLSMQLRTHGSFFSLILQLFFFRNLFCLFLHSCVIYHTCTRTKFVLSNTLISIFFVSPAPAP